MKDILNEIDLQEVSLRRINVESHPEDIEDEKIKVNMHWVVTFEKDGENLYIKPIFKFEVIPDALFNAEAEYRIVYKIKKGLSDKEIKEHLEELAQPCAGRNSLLIGQISQQVVDGSPIIPAPYIEIKKKDKA